MRRFRYKTNIKPSDADLSTTILTFYEKLKSYKETVPELDSFLREWIMKGIIIFDKVDRVYRFISDSWTVIWKDDKVYSIWKTQKHLKCCVFVHDSDWMSFASLPDDTNGTLPIVQDIDRTEEELDAEELRYLTVEYFDRWAPLPGLVVTIDNGADVWLVDEYNIDTREFHLSKDLDQRVVKETRVRPYFPS